MVVGDLDVEGVSIPPAETDPPLVVDPDTVLPFTVARDVIHLPAMSSDQSCAGKIVLVTGAQRGIGRAIALRFAAAGADVALNFLDD